MILRHRLTAGLLGLVLALSACSGGSKDSAKSDDSGKSLREKRLAQRQGGQQQAPADAPANPFEAIEGLPQLMRPDQPGEAVPGDWVTIVVSGEPTTLNPLFSSSVEESTINSLIYEGGTTYDFNQTVMPNIYESWEPTEDFKTIIVRLAKGFQWSDGKPVTAHDFAFGWRMALDERLPAYTYRDGALDFEIVEATDDYTLRMVFKKPTARWKSDTDQPLLPRHIYEPLANDPDAFQKSEYNRKPICNGPYRVERWDTQDRVVLVRNENYTGKRPGLVDRIILRIIPNSTVAINSFIAGEVDALYMRPEELLTYVKDPKFSERATVKIRSTPGYIYVGWNMDGSNPFFSDKRVRQAMTYACDRFSVKRNVFHNLREVSNGIFHPAQEFSNKEITPLPFSLEEARKLLDEAGWKDSDGDGLRDKDGVKFSFELLFPSGGTDAERVAQIFQADMKKVGVDMQLRPMEWATMQDKTDKKEFQAYLAGWGGGFFPETAFNIWHSTMAKGGRNYVSYSNPRVDELMDVGRFEFDPVKQNEIYREAQKLIYEDQPYTFITFTNSIYAHDKRIQGVRMSLHGPYRFDPGIRGWWVPKDQQKYGK